MNAMAFIARNVRLTTNTKTCESRGTKKDALHEESILFYVYCTSTVSIVCS